jgi:rRNA maturation protein Rpf1
MSDRHIPASETKAFQQLDIVIAKKLPGILEQLDPKHSQEVRNHVYDLTKNAGGKVPIDVILRMKYDFLVQSGHVKAFTDEEIILANVAE